MVTIITLSTEPLSRLNISSILRIDLIIFLILIGLLIFKEFLKPFFDQHNFPQPEIKLFIEKIIYVAIIPFFFIFIYVLIYRYLNTV
jgi:hypothetical protein